MVARALSTAVLVAAMAAAALAWQLGGELHGKPAGQFADVTRAAVVVAAAFLVLGLVGSLRVDGVARRAGAAVAEPVSVDG